MESYSFEKDLLKQSPSDRVKRILTPRTPDEKGEALLEEVIRHGRDIANLPNNFLHPSDFADYALWLGRAYSLDCTVLGKAELKAIGCGGILAVNQGSATEEKLIVLSYRGAGEEPVTGLIGKGLMFDSGGYHLKSADGMEGMQYDMCGAAYVLSVMEYLARTRAKVNVTAVIPCAENLIGPEALRGSDVITLLSGKTVEVVFTDAEGRLVLADAMTYALNLGCSRLIDMATLTYSCMNALGSEYTGMFSNDDAMAEAFTASARRAGEKVWRLPLDEAYRQEVRKSLTADLRNYVKGPGGALTAAAFLWEFCGDVPWLHLDMVGTASRKTKTGDHGQGATGAMVATVIDYLGGHTPCSALLRGKE